MCIRNVIKTRNQRDALYTFLQVILRQYRVIISDRFFFYAIVSCNSLAVDVLIVLLSLLTA